MIEALTANNGLSTRALKEATGMNGSKLPMALAVLGARVQRREEAVGNVTSMKHYLVELPASVEEQAEAEYYEQQQGWLDEPREDRPALERLRYRFVAVNSNGR